jgi:hypothetical protein
MLNTVLEAKPRMTRKWKTVADTTMAFKNEFLTLLGYPVPKGSAGETTEEFLDCVDANALAD